MRILSFHPFSIFANGGGSRILRRLYEGHEMQVTALVVDGFSTTLPKGNINEVLVPATPVHRSWMRWRLRNLGMWMRRVLFKSVTEKRIRQAARKIEYDVLHVVGHGSYCAALCTDEFCNGKQLWVSFHDHFNTLHCTQHDMGLLWTRADRRLVISEEIATEYNRLFGAAAYEVITDGVEAGEVKQPARHTGNPVTIYFAGMLHLSYLPLFEAFANALDMVAQQQGIAFKFLLRGTQQLEFLANRGFETEYRPLTLSNAELKAELDAADILYLPIKFSDPDFYLYSLSTKMVGYLGAPGTILFHGPEDAAACRLLKNWEAAVCCVTLDTLQLTSCLTNVLAGTQVSANAKQLARARFNINGIRAAFWNGVATNSLKETASG